MKKKVLFLCSNMDIGGFQKSLINLLEYFDYSKYECDLLLIDDSGIYIDYINKNVNIICDEEKKDYFLSFNKSIIKLIKSRKILWALRRILNLVISLVDKGEGAIFMSKMVPRFHDEYDVCIDYCGQYLNYYMIDYVNAKKKITYFHNDYSKWDKYYKADKRYYKKVDYIVTVSEECVVSMVKYFPSEKDKIVCIENIITRKTIETFAGKLKDNTKKNVICSVGRVCLDKGIDLAIETADLLKRQYMKDFVWYWVGPGHIEEYQAKVNSYNLQENFIMVGPKINPYVYIEDAELIVHPARFEGKAVAVEEALVMNKPIIATNYSTVANQIVQGLSGIIVEFDKYELANAIIDILQDEEKKQKIIKYQSENCKGNDYQINMLYRLME